MLGCVNKCNNDISLLGKCVKECLPIKEACEEKEKLEKSKLIEERERKKFEDL